jgi:predicted RNase H-like HicB family nuclease
MLSFNKIDKLEGKMIYQMTAVIEKEDAGYVALCPELDIASQGDTIEMARKNLQEALELFFESASPKEIRKRLHEEVYITHLEVNVG